MENRGRLDRGRLNQTDHNNSFPFRRRYKLISDIAVLSIWNTSFLSLFGVFTSTHKLVFHALTAAYINPFSTGIISIHLLPYWARETRINHRTHEQKNKQTCMQILEMHKHSFHIRIKCIHSLRLLHVLPCANPPPLPGIVSWITGGMWRGENNGMTLSKPRINLPVYQLFLFAFLLSH